MLRGRPTDGPLKNAPFNTYFLLNVFSTYTSRPEQRVADDDRVACGGVEDCARGDVRSFVEVEQAGAIAAWQSAGSLPFVRPEP